MSCPSLDAGVFSLRRRAQRAVFFDPVSSRTFTAVSDHCLNAVHFMHRYDASTFFRHVIDYKRSRIPSSPSVGTHPCVDRLVAPDRDATWPQVGVVVVYVDETERLETYTGFVKYVNRFTRPDG
jgi:hypothetical protein